MRCNRDKGTLFNGIQAGTPESTGFPVGFMHCSGGVEWGCGLFLHLNSQRSININSKQTWTELSNGGRL